MLIFVAIIVIIELLAGFYYADLLPICPKLHHQYTYAMPDFLNDGACYAQGSPMSKEPKPQARQIEFEISDKGVIHVNSESLLNSLNVKSQIEAVKKLRKSRALAPL